MDCMLSNENGQGRGSGSMKRDGAQLRNMDAPSGVLVGVSELEGPAAVKAARREGSQEGMPTLHVLVVDDDGAVRRACVTIAEGMGCAVMSAESVARARTILKH